MNLKKILLGFCTLFFVGSLSAQLTLVGGQTVVDLVTNVLVGGGLPISNITYNGSGPNANLVQGGVQFFNNNGTAFPFSSGMVLRTDNAPTVAGDSDLNALSFPNSVTNGSIVEFDFVATGDTMSFNFIFASAEYTSYTCSNVNDVFGFFLSGPGINGPYQNNAINIATIPGTNTPIGINTVNSGFPANNSTCLAANPNYMTDNIYFTLSYNSLIGPLTTTSPQYNGSTVVMTAFSGLECDETYHIKLGIANVGDQAFNSIVFLEAESFQVYGYEIIVEPSVQGPTVDGFFAEGCTSATLAVVRGSDDSINDTICVPIEVEGTIDPALDLLNWPSEICFPPGVDTVYISFIPINDGIDEDPEFLTITLTAVNGCGVETPTSITLWVVDKYDLEYDITPNTTVQCIPTTANASVTNLINNVGSVTYSWTADGTPVGGNSPNITMGPGTSPQDTIVYVVTMTDSCQTYTDTILYIVNQTLQINPNSGPTACGLASGFVQFPVVGQTGTVAYQLTGDGIGGVLTQNVQQNLPSGWYYVTATDAVCTATDSVFVDILDPPVAGISASPLAGYSPFTTTFVNSSQNGDSYWWDFGNGETLTTNNTSSQTITYEGEGPLDITVCVAAIQEGCQDTACVVVTILEFIPPPYAETPNVFSPNGDDVNDEWQFVVLNNVVEVELVIVNRWGNVVHEQKAAIPTWNGRLADGSEATEGVYFFRYKATGLDGSIIEGHGYTQLIRQ